MTTDELIKEFNDNYIKEPLIEYSVEQLMDILQDFLIDRGYGKTKTIATIEYVTNGGQGVDLSSFLA